MPATKPYAQRRVSTFFLRVPIGEWPAVKRGLKREFRAPRGQISQLWAVKLPTPVVAYAVGRRGNHEACLMVLERMWREPLGAISPESLKAEGCASLGEFRRKWMMREKKRFRPLDLTTVYVVRPWRPGLDEREMADRLLHHLYFEWLDGEEDEEAA